MCSQAPARDTAAAAAGGLEQPIRAGRVAMDGVEVELEAAAARLDEEDAAADTSDDGRGAWAAATSRRSAASDDDEDDAEQDDGGRSLQALVQSAVQSAPKGAGALEFAGTRMRRPQMEDADVDDYGIGDDDGFGFAKTYDSDDDGRGGGGRTGREVTRDDFETDEDYASYKARQATDAG